MKSNFFSLTCCVLGLAVMLTAGCDSKKTSTAPSGGPSGSSSGAKRIVLLINTDSPFWDAARAGVKKATEDLKLADAAVSAGMDTNDGGDNGQIEKLRQYGTQSDIAAVVISPANAKNLAIAEELENLRKKGVIIVCFDSDLVKENRGVREVYIGSNNVTGGKLLATAANLIKPNAAYSQFVGYDSQENAVERMDGFSSVYKGTEKERKIDQTIQSAARDNVRDVISKYPELGLLVGIWSYNAPAIVDVVTEKNVRDKFAITTFDAEPIAVQYMTEGKIDVMVVQNPFMMGYDSVKYVFARMQNDEKTIKEMFPKKGEPGGDVRDTGLKIVAPDKNTPLTKEAFVEFGSSVEFLSLSQFTEWLKKYNLTGS